MRARLNNERVLANCDRLCQRSVVRPTAVCVKVSVVSIYQTYQVPTYYTCCCRDYRYDSIRIPRSCRQIKFYYVLLYVRVHKERRLLYPDVDKQLARSRMAGTEAVES